MEEVCKELPEECWELIINRLDHHRLWEQLSLVSKKLFSITNQLRVSLKVINPSIEVFHKQLLRFQHVRKIDLSSFRGALDEALIEIAQSGVNIEELNISNKSKFPVILKDLGSKMKNIKVFSCSKSYLTDSDLVVLAESLPMIEELDISQQHFQYITDEGIAAMSKKLKRLRTINLTGNTKISDQSVISLSSNCESLTNIVLRFCYNVSQTGISFAMENSHNYNSLILDGRYLELTNPLNFSKCISTIDLYCMKISDEFLCGIVKANLPLKSFHLSSCKNFTVGGISLLLKAYPSLESLSLSGTDFLTDESVIHICQFISKLNSIELNSCYKLTCSSFIAISSACPRISKIEMRFLSERVTGLHYASGSTKNPSLTSASLSATALKRLFYICPNLQVVELSGEVDLVFILKSCPNITQLTVTSFKISLATWEGEEEVCNLEWLNAKNSVIDDKLLKIVAKRCPRLYHLNLEGCKRVTERGVREVAEHCRRLRYINLDWCMSVNKDVVAYMVSSCTSLRQIVTPGPTDHTIQVLEGFLRQGCLVIPGSWEDEYY